MYFSRHPIAEAHGLVYDAKAKGTWDQLCNKGAVLAKIMMPVPDNNDNTNANVNITTVNINTTTTNTSSTTKPPSSTPSAAKESQRQTVWVMGTHLQADEGLKCGQLC